MKFYVLDDQDQLVPATKDEWMTWKSGDVFRSVVRSNVLSGVRIETTFNGIVTDRDQDDPPLVFETATYRLGLRTLVERYATWAEAVAGHTRAVDAELAKRRSA